MTITTTSSASLQIDQRVCLYAQDPAWQRTWLAIEAAEWRSLIFVPAGDFSSLDLVHGLATVGWHQRGSPLIVADLRAVGLSALMAVRSEIRERVQNGDRILIAAAGLQQNPTTASIAREADKAILCVTAGCTARSQVKDALRELGAQRCLGTIMTYAHGS